MHQGLTPSPEVLHQWNTRSRHSCFSWGHWGPSLPSSSCHQVPPWEHMYSFPSRNEPCLSLPKRSTFSFPFQRAPCIERKEYVPRNEREPTRKTQSQSCFVFLINLVEKMLARRDDAWRHACNCKKLFVAKYVDLYRGRNTVSRKSCVFRASSCFRRCASSVFFFSAFAVYRDANRGEPSRLTSGTLMTRNAHHHVNMTTILKKFKNRTHHT